ncbi:hypothetical protein [Thaumasiovibrio sp. DFM-14]|uniref:hypothetical protein n=1 Tax=Thaumasiovibrio sp. DFM-14 TaxID=3384792 RepID=UPI00399F1868
MKKLTGLVSAALLVSPTIYANENINGIWDNVELAGYGSIVNVADSLNRIGGIGDVYISAPTVSGGKASRVLTGFEYEEAVYHNNPRSLLKSIIFADGSTKISDNFRMAYLLKETHQYNGRDNTSADSAAQTIELMPRYEKWISPELSYAFEFGYEKVTGGLSDYQDRTNYSITPELNLGYDKHFLHLNLQVGYMDHGDRGMFIESEPLYIYQYNDWINLGAKVLYNEEKNDFAWKEYAFKPLVQFNFKNGIYLELRYERQETEQQGGATSYSSNNYALYSEVPLTSDISFLADLAIRKGEVGGTSEYNWGDKEIAFAKVGLIWTF